MSPEPFRVRGEAGLEIEVFDVVGNAHPQLVDPMVALHSEVFAQYPFVVDAMRADAVLPPQRHGLIVHQYVLTVDGAPAAFIRGASNLVRRTAVIEFLAVSPSFRRVHVEGRRLADWFMRHCQTQYRLDTGTECLGCTGEVPRSALKPFFEYGWLELPCDYCEPVHGWNWHEHDLETRDVTLIWLPNPNDPQPPSMQELVAPLAAGYLLDTYRLPATLEWVADLVGDHADRRVDRAPVDSPNVS